MKSVRFEWDEAKRQANLGKHGLDFTDAETVFADDTASFEDDRENYGEQRFLSFGLLQGRVVVIPHRTGGRDSGHLDEKGQQA